MWTDPSVAVAQSGTLLYRRLAVGGVFALSNVSVPAGALQIENLRYGRVQLCATSNPAAWLRVPHLGKMDKLNRHRAKSHA